MNNQPEWLDDLIPSEETEEVEYAFCVPLKNGGFAWLVDMGDDTYIKKSEDGYWNALPTNCGMMKRQKSYLEEIKSGKGNWIINPIHDNSDLKWSELDYANAAVVKRMVKVTKEYNYEVVK